MVPKCNKNEYRFSSIILLCCVELGQATHRQWRLRCRCCYSQNSEADGLQRKTLEFEIFSSHSMVIGKLLEFLFCLCFMLDIVIILGLYVIFRVYHSRVYQQFCVALGTGHHSDSHHSDTPLGHL